MINPSVSPQVNNLSAETRNFKTDASGYDNSVCFRPVDLRQSLIAQLQKADLTLFVWSNKRLYELSGHLFDAETGSAL